MADPTREEVVRALREVEEISRRGTVPLEEVRRQLGDEISGLLPWWPWLRWLPLRWQGYLSRHGKIHIWWWNGPKTMWRHRRYRLRLKLRMLFWRLGPLYETIR